VTLQKQGGCKIAGTSVLTTAEAANCASSHYIPHSPKLERKKEKVFPLRMPLMKQ